MIESKAGEIGTSKNGGGCGSDGLAVFNREGINIFTCQCSLFFLFNFFHFIVCLCGGECVCVCVCLWEGYVYVAGIYAVCRCQRTILRVLSQAPFTLSF